ncbi:hypothetical protein AB0J38_26485 [Streptomyces sp. NPDC050095]|uniref:hypothetical protein n=1 Tax=unclassified Streptomyces TaxID=2593676 RepID=UPI0034300BD9
MTEESAEAARAAGGATVLVSDPEHWRKKRFAPGVELVTLSSLEMAHGPRRCEWLLLFRLPRLLAAALGRGPLRSPVRRLERAYERLVAGPLHRKVFLPVYRGAYPDLRGRLVRQLARRTGADLVVVTDAGSLPYATRLADGPNAPALAYSLPPR